MSSRRWKTDTPVPSIRARVCVPVCVWTLPHTVRPFIQIFILAPRCRRRYTLRERITNPRHRLVSRTQTPFGYYICINIYQLYTTRRCQGEATPPPLVFNFNLFVLFVFFLGGGGGGLIVINYCMNNNIIDRTISIIDQSQGRRRRKLTCLRTHAYTTLSEQTRACSTEENLHPARASYTMHRSWSLSIIYVEDSIIICAEGKKENLESNDILDFFEK